MPFEKGNKLSPGGKKGNKGGRPSKEQLAMREEVKRLVQAELEKHVMAVIGAGRKIATGVRRRKHNPKTGEAYYEIEYDGAMIRHWIDKFLPAAKPEVDVAMHGTVNVFTNVDPDARRRKRENPTAVGRR